MVVDPWAALTARLTCQTAPGTTPAMVGQQGPPGLLRHPAVSNAPPHVLPSQPMHAPGSAVSAGAGTAPPGINRWPPGPAHIPAGTMFPRMHPPPGITAPPPSRGQIATALPGPGLVPQSQLWQQQQQRSHQGRPGCTGEKHSLSLDSATIERMRAQSRNNAMSVAEQVAALKVELGASVSQPSAQLSGQATVSSAVATETDKPADAAGQDLTGSGEIVLDDY